VLHTAGNVYVQIRSSQRQSMIQCHQLWRSSYRTPVTRFDYTVAIAVDTVECGCDAGTVFPITREV